MYRAAISGIGVEIPEASITNDELVASFNAWVDKENAVRGAAGEPLLQKSDTDFILYASGVKERHVLVLDGILDPERMTPRIPFRDDSELSVMAEFGVKSAKQALDHAGLQAADIDMVICAASHHQRPYPAIAIEIQDALGIAGRGLRHGARLLVGGRRPACRLQPGAHRRTAAHPRRDAGNHHRPSQFPRPPDAFHLRRRLDLDDRASGSTRAATLPGRFEIVDTRSWTQFSNNIRTNFGFLVRAGQDDTSAVLMEGNMIKQVGNKVFKEVTVAGHRFIVQFLAEHGLTPHGIRRFWLHQANARMNAMILKLAFGHEVDHDRAPMVLERLGNTAAAGAIIALKENHEDMAARRLRPDLRLRRRLFDRRRAGQDDVSADRRRHRSASTAFGWTRRRFRRQM